MRKVLVGVVVVLVAALMVLPALAQDGGSLEYGQTVSGEITEDTLEQTYTFTGSAGDLIMVEMSSNDDNFLDPMLTLSGPDSAVIAENDDFVGLDALIVAILPADGSYSIGAMRSDFGDSVGGYDLSLKQADLLQPGDSAEATVFSDYEKDVPTYIVVQPETSGVWAISYEQPAGDLHASITMFDASTGDYVFDLSETTGARSGTINVDLEGGVPYIIAVQQSFGSFTFDDTSMQVIISTAIVE